MEYTVGLRTMLDIELLLAVCVAFEFGFAQDDRVIDETPITVKVISGSTAILPCTVDPKYTESYGDQYSVLWQNPIQTVISVRDRRVLTDMRISVERPFLSDWNLHIRNVSVTDKGEYKCQINTDPVRSKRVKLVVQVPPTIIDYTESNDVKARVGDHVELMCNATGIPPPVITWYRLNVWGSKLREKVGKEGNVLRIHNITQSCADTYECLANNTVPPVMNRQIQVTVEYPPQIRLHNSRISQMVGKETILECIISASPLGVTSWTRNNKRLSNSIKYELDLYNDGQDKITLSLRIAHIDRSDFGEYVCEASNSLGKTKAIMKLVEVFPVTTTTPPPPTTTTIPRHIVVLENDNDDHKRKHDTNNWDGNNAFLDENKWQGNSWNTQAPGKRPVTPVARNPDRKQPLTGVFGTGSYSAGAKRSASSVSIVLAMMMSIACSFRPSVLNAQ
ncbi:limbic system-associated membrane protein-like [Haliotis rufescens]|uniref:limbic system-associated membrane protein-like n=1 Tax=Haliotis rufescens TaxID=6454 RepID=UPI001EB09A98|nr:limbic system-associated membrane protein-like [Haliotis rufescens]